MHLDQLGGELICQKDSFLCAARGVQIGIAFQKKFGVGLFGGEGFIMQRLTGDGIALFHAGGTMLERTLEAGEMLKLDTGCLVAIQPSVQLRHPVRRRYQEHALRRRGIVFRHSDRAGTGVVPVVALLAPGRAHRGRGTAHGRRRPRGRFDPRRPGPHVRRRLMPHRPQYPANFRSGWANMAALGGWTPDLVCGRVSGDRRRRLRRTIPIFTAERRR